MKDIYDHYHWKDERFEALIGLAASTLGCGYFAKKYFWKVYRYKKRILDRLERDRRILAVLEAI